MPSGGYRKPSNPAPVSNPGSGRRTDGGAAQPIRPVSGMPYGQNQQVNSLQAAAPMAAQSKPSAASAPQLSKSTNPIVPLTAPTERPNVPATNGMPFGAGAGPEILGLNQPSASLSQTLAKIVQFDPTGEAAELYDYLISRGL